MKSKSIVVSRKIEAGRYVYIFDGSSLSSEVYYCVMKAGKFVNLKKTMLIK